MLRAGSPEFMETLFDKENAVSLDRTPLRQSKMG